ncbi:histone-like nucleoid-structuring protein Lsr2 [Arthrobacter sp. ok909]|uniref:Lsr2 dimerization domain-containing protein n=1 Tax=Arthrobacter sp. ok909 TaxID=1761746 RepID=UPI000B89FEA7|nr:histone-like nucleoid-structuring protein Lsr2 [Arthrobacter sp. ok909]
MKVPLWPREVHVQLIDDLSGGGGDAEETVRFSIEGTDYETDLSAANAAELRCCPDAVRTKPVLGLAWGEGACAHECAPAGGRMGIRGRLRIGGAGVRDSLTTPYNASGVSKAKERNSDDG